MTKIRVRLKASFGDVEIESDRPEDILRALEDAPRDFGERIAQLSPKLVARITERAVMEELRGIIERTEKGPLIAIPGRIALTHYEAIGLLLYASSDMMNTAATLTKLLKESGVGNVMVPARLNEMRRRRFVYKPRHDRPQWKLTSTGVEWVRSVIRRVKEAM